MPKAMASVESGKNTSVRASPAMRCPKWSSLISVAPSDEYSIGESCRAPANQLIANIAVQTPPITNQIFGSASGEMGGGRKSSS